MNKHQAVIFDYGNVLSLDQCRELVATMANRTGADIAEFEKCYWDARHPYDRGEIHGREYWLQVGAGLGKKLSDKEIDELIEFDNRSWCKPNQRILNWAHAFKKHGLKLAILSNMPSDFHRDLPKNCSWLPEFDHHTYSCTLKLAKPEAAIYEHCIQGLNVEPAKTLFIDDREVNIAAAEKLGIDGLLFTSTEEVEAKLRSLFDIPVAVG